MRSSGLGALALRGGIRPPILAGWSDTRRRFIRWRDTGVWERPLEIRSTLLAADAHDMPVRAFVTQGATSGLRSGNRALIGGFAAERLLADNGHDRDGVLARAERRGMEFEGALPVFF